MNIYFLPLWVRDKIERVINLFWYGNHQSPCMRFCSLYDFILALLEKTVTSLN